jgi:hypothetical protein
VEKRIVARWVGWKSDGASIAIVLCTIKELNDQRIQDNRRIDIGKIYSEIVAIDGKKMFYFVEISKEVSYIAYALKNMVILQKSKTSNYYIDPI